MHSLYTRRWLPCALALWLCTAVAWAQQPQKPQQPPKSQQSSKSQKPSQPAAAQDQAQGGGATFVDGIAAVVNRRVITLSRLQAEAQLAEIQLKRQNIAVPEQDILRKQVLQRLIGEELINQEAERMNIRVSDADVKRAVGTIAERNHLTVEQLRAEIEKTGASWEAYLKNLRQEVRADLVRQRAVDSTIMITDAEVDAYLKAQERRGSGSPGLSRAAAAPPVALGLAQILVAVPEGAPAGQVQQLRRKAEDILGRLRGGADFASLAASSSDAPEALQGGALGVRPMDGWPDLFLQAVQNVQVGGVSDIIQSGNGFHILKVLEREQPGGAQAAPGQAAQQAQQPQMPQGPVMVTQTHARHILIKVSPALSEERALERLRQLRQRISMGEDFQDLARRFSEDASAPQGGDLGWVNPGEMVPAFERAMNALQPGQVSEPIQTQFGWHLIEVLERRTKNMEDEYRRMQARQVLFQRRAEPAFEDWLSHLQGQAYIDNRLDPKSSRRPR